MKVVKPMRLGLLQRVVEHNRRCTLVVSVLVYLPLDGPRRLLSEQVMWKQLSEVLPGGMLDEGNPKPRAEVLASARAFAPSGTAGAVMVEMKVEREGKPLVSKKLAVIGDRYWKGNKATDPIAFSEMPIDYGHAFGGEGYAANPTGKGIAPVSTDHGEVHPLPNVEDPKHLVAARGDRPMPAGLGAYDLTWPQRFEKMGKRYDGTWLKTRFPGPAEDFDAHFYNTAPPDQQFDGFFRGDERFSLEGMHPTKRRLEGSFEPLVARVFVTQHRAEGEVFKAFGSRLDTIHFVPHLERAVLIYRATLPVAEDDADDIVHLMIAAEAPEHPKPLEHYQAVLAQRLDKEKGSLAALKDEDLMPPKAEGWSAGVDFGDVGQMVKLEHRALEKQARGRERKLEEGRRKLTAAGYDVDAAFSIPELPTVPDPFDIDALLELKDEMAARAEKQRREMEQKRQEMEVEAREAYARGGFDYDLEMEKARGKTAGPPKFSADEQLISLHEMVRISREGGQPLEKLERDLTDPSYEQSLRDLEKQVNESYARFAHWMPAALAPDDERRQMLRVQVLTAKDSGTALTAVNLTGADLRDLDLRGMDLSGAFLECADLSGADLSDANLTGAVLTRAKLERTNLSGATLTNTNLGATRLKDTNLSGALLDGTVLARAELDGVLLHGAKLRETTLIETTFIDADMSHVEADKPLFLKTDLRRVTMLGARMTQPRFVEADVRGVDWTGADIRKAMFVKSMGDGANFANANLEGAVFVYESSFTNCVFAQANLGSVNALKTPLTGGNFEHARMDGANLMGCDLRGANLHRAVARQALFVRANLEGANMRGIDLLGAILQKARLAGTDLTGANLSRADLSLARMDGSTRLDEALMLDTRIEPIYQPPREGAR